MRDSCSLPRNLQPMPCSKVMFDWMKYGSLGPLHVHSSMEACDKRYGISAAIDSIKARIVVRTVFNQEPLFVLEQDRGILDPQEQKYMQELDHEYTFIADHAKCVAESIDDLEAYASRMRLWIRKQMQEWGDVPKKERDRIARESTYKKEFLDEEKAIRDEICETMRRMKGETVYMLAKLMERTLRGSKNTFDTVDTDPLLDIQPMFEMFDDVRERLNEIWDYARSGLAAVPADTVTAASATVETPPNPLHWDI